MVNMIKVIISNKKIEISGHAGYEDLGKDIVCASVSSIVYTTINAIFNFSEDLIKVSDKEVVTINIINKTKELDILINNMITLLKALEIKYPKNIKIRGE